MTTIVDAMADMYARTERATVRRRVSMIRWQAERVGPSDLRFYSLAWLIAPEQEQARVLAESEEYRRQAHAARVAKER